MKHKVGKKKSHRRRRHTTVHPSMHHLVGKALHKSTKHKVSHKHKK